MGLCSSRNGDREGEGESDWLCSSSSWRCPGDQRGTQPKTRESPEKTEEVKPKQHASWNWKPTQKWEQDWALVVTRTGTRLRGRKVKEIRLVLFFIGRNWRICTGKRDRITSRGSNRWLKGGTLASHMPRLTAMTSDNIKRTVLNAMTRRAAHRIINGDANWRWQVLGQTDLGHTSTVNFIFFPFFTYSLF